MFYAGIKPPLFLYQIKRENRIGGGQTMQANIKEAIELSKQLHSILSNLEDKTDFVKKLKNMEVIFSEMIKEQESDRLLIDSLMSEIKDKNEQITHFKKVINNVSGHLKTLNTAPIVPRKKRMLDV